MTDRTTSGYRGLIDRYWDRFPMNDRGSVITLLEGNTPLVRAPRLADTIAPGVEIYLKYDGLNPTCSFKDRGMTLAVSKAVEEGSEAVICASTGNTSASAAAYAAKAGIRAYVLIPQGKIALGKLSQAVMHGATVIQVEGNFDEALMLVREISESHPVTMVNSLNEFRIIGQKTAAFEIIDALGDAPDYHALPVGNAGNITSYWMGYTEYFKDNVATRTPKMIGFQAAGAAPDREGGGGDEPRDHRHRHPHRQPGVVEAGGAGPGRIRGIHRYGHRRGDPRGLPNRRRRRGGFSASQPRRRRWRGSGRRRSGACSKRASGSSAPSPATV